MMTLSHDLVGTIPQWISAGGIVGFLGMIVKWRLGERGLDSAERGDIRDHYVVELSALRDRLDAADQRYMVALRTADERWEESSRRHEECVKEREALRDELTGLRREFAQSAKSTARLLGKSPVLPPEKGND